MSFATVLLTTFSGCTAPESDSHRYATWDSMELDKCASAWLIKRHIDPDAEFTFYPVGSLVTDGIPFDTPDAELRRTGTLCTFEVIMKTHDLSHPVLEQIGQVVHRLEMRSWETPRDRMPAGDLAVDAVIRDIIASASTPEQCFVASMGAFDSVYAAWLAGRGESP